MNWSLGVVAFLFIGFVLLLFEIFIIPGFGPVGIAAILFLTIGTYIAWAKLSVTFAIIITLSSILSVIASIVFFRKSGIANKLVLGGSIEDASTSENQDQGNSSLVSVGEIGYTISDIRPTGIAEFQNQRINVITDGIYIKRNTKVKITLIEGNRIFIEEA